MKLHPVQIADKTTSPLEVIHNSSHWHRQLWRGRKFSENNISRVLSHLDQNNLGIAGDGSIRDQLGSFAFCFASENRDRPFLTCTGPVDGHRHHMRALRAESTPILAAIFFLHRLEPFVKAEGLTIPVYTDCKTLVNRLNMKRINRPSLVLGDHMDLIYEIRSIIAKSEFKYEFKFARAIKETEIDIKSPEEKLVQQMHVRAYSYYLQKGFVVPRYFSDLLIGAGISLMANGKPIVSNIGVSLQNLEQKKLQEDYFIDRMNMDATQLN